MQEVKKVLDQLMDTPAVELVNLKNDDIIKTEALIACSRYGNPQSKKDLGDVTYRDFLRSFFQFYRKNLKDQGLVFSFVYDWAYLIESSPILQKFNDLDYNKCVEVASEAIANEKALDAFISGVNNKVSLELQSRIAIQQWEPILIWQPRHFFQQEMTSFPRRNTRIIWIAL